MNRPGFLIPILAFAAIFFGWRAYEAWTRPLGAEGPPPSNPAVVPIGVSQEEGSPPPDLSAPVASIVARPVFRPDRRQFREETAAQTPKRNYEAELGRFTLLGVLLLGKEKKGVVVGKGGPGREERWEISPGDSLPGFIVKDVGTEGVTLTADDRDFLLPLYAGGPKGPPGKAPGRTEVAPSSVPAAPPPAASPQPPPAVRPGTVPAAPADNVYSPPARALPTRESPFLRRRGRTIRPNIPGGN
jgi:hypothetical protein